MSTGGMNWADKARLIAHGRQLLGAERWDDAVSGMDINQKVEAAEWLISERRDWLTEKVIQRTEERYVDEKALLEARRKVAAEYFTGTNELSWEDLEEVTSRYLVQDLLPADSVCFLVAKPNIGKTFAYVDMVCRMAFGMPWLGKQTEQVKTLLVLAEGRNGFIDRLRSWCDANGKDIEDLKPWLFFTDGVNLNNDDSIGKVKAIIDREDIELVVFDTWANVHGGQSEDDGALNSVTLDRAVSIKPGTTLLFVHHPRKSDEDSEAPVMRGSGSLAGRAEVVMTMFRDKKYSPVTGEKYEFLGLSTENSHAGKNRTAKTETIQGLYLEESGESAVLRQLESEAISFQSRKVRDSLRGKMTQAEYAKAAGQQVKTAGRHLDKAVEEGVAVVDETVKPKVYALAPGVEPQRLSTSKLLEVISAA